MRPRVLALLVLLLAPAARAQMGGVAPLGAEPPMSARRTKKDDKDDKSAKIDAARRPDLRTVSGEISALAWQDRRFTVDGADGPVTLRVDRNTLVFLDGHVGTVRDLAVGTLVRANIGGGQNLASWVEVRHPTRGQEPTPPAAPTEGGARGADDATTGTGSSDRGPRSAPPISPPSAPSPTGPAGPTGPSPVPGGAASKP